MKRFIFVFSVLTGCAFSQTPKQKVDSLEFQVGYPLPQKGALDQLKNFPSPRYIPNNDFIRLYNWMSPFYAGGAGQDGVSNPDAVKNATSLQEELGMNWNYFIVISNPGIDPQERILNNPNASVTAFIALANKHPEIPLGVTTFWEQMAPRAFGRNYDKANVIRQDLPKIFCINDTTGNFKRKVISYVAPDSLFVQDGQVQKKELELLVKHLTRPINLINENGEEPPKPYGESILRCDPKIVNDKNKLQIESWGLYTATKKKQMRELYSSQFMDGIPQLKNTSFTFYQVEGGPIDRYNWNISKGTNTKIKGNYYSTPDFYPRVPDNWKEWKGAWHGWKWINDGRKVEISSGDRFFSPYVAAGWSHDPEIDMRPAQWLGLLKCLNVVGAEFFYTGYFNESKPFSLPENYIWQIAMPAYAQAIATHYSDVFRNGNVLMDAKQNPIVTYPDTEADVLITVRKHDHKEIYVIAGTVQPNSNTENSPLQKNVEIQLAGETLKLNVRRQGSVYIYDKSISPAIFYQLDKWHQYEHPSRWRKSWINEAEIFDTASNNAGALVRSVYQKTNNTSDFTNAESYIELNKKQWVSYTFYKRDMEHLRPNLFLHAYVKSSAPIKFELMIDGQKQEVNEKETPTWKWITVPVKMNGGGPGEAIKLESLTDLFMIDKIVINDSQGIPDLSGY
jgi:hypothetical protein